MIKRIIAILCLLVCLISGFGIGLISSSYIRQKQYDLGVVSFCQLIEADRLKVCPAARAAAELKDGGRIIIYACDDHRLYLETNNVPEDSENVKNILEIYETKGKHLVSKCKTDYGTIYGLVQHE